MLKELETCVYDDRIPGGRGRNLQVILNPAKPVLWPQLSAERSTHPLHYDEARPQTGQREAEDTEAPTEGTAVHGLWSFDSSTDHRLSVALSLATLFVSFL